MSLSAQLKGASLDPALLYPLHGPGFEPMSIGTRSTAAQVTFLMMQKRDKEGGGFDDSEGIERQE